MSELPPRPQSTGMNSLRDPRSCMAMSQYQSLPPTSISVPSLCVTCQSSCPMTMSNVLSSLSVLFAQSINVSFVSFHPLPTELVASSSLSSSVTPVTVQSTPVAVSSVSPPTAVSPVSCCSAAPRDEDVSMSSQLFLPFLFVPR